MSAFSFSFLTLRILLASCSCRPGRPSCSRDFTASPTFVTVVDPVLTSVRSTTPYSLSAEVVLALARAELWLMKSLRITGPPPVYVVPPLKQQPDLCAVSFLSQGYSRYSARSRLCRGLCLCTGLPKPCLGRSTNSTSRSNFLFCLGISSSRPPSIVLPNTVTIDIHVLLAED